MVTVVGLLAVLAKAGSKWLSSGVDKARASQTAEEDLARLEAQHAARGEAVDRLREPTSWGQAARRSRGGSIIEGLSDGFGDLGLEGRRGDRRDQGSDDAGARRDR